MHFNYPKELTAVCMYCCELSGVSVVYLKNIKQRSRYERAFNPSALQRQHAVCVSYGTTTTCEVKSSS